jgi:hypothetical protein
MNLPKRISKVLKQKQEFIDLSRSQMEKKIAKSQSEFLKEILSDLISSLKYDRYGNILDTKENYRILGDFNKMSNTFTQALSETMSKMVMSATSGIAALNKKYFAVALTDIPGRFDKIIETTASKINLRIGLEGGEMVRGGWLESFLKDKTMDFQVKNYISKSITGQVDTKDFIRGLSDIVNGVGEGPGTLERQYQRFAYDMYQQYDAAYASTLGQEFGMKYFAYQGGLIDDSRDFCAAHNDKVWSVEESQTWYEWVPADGQYPEGYVIKAKEIYEHPSYMDYPGYNPLIDRGGYNCRHSIGFISDDLAFDLRPELKGTE